jgi:hypothetical protein
MKVSCYQRFGPCRSKAALIYRSEASRFASGKSPMEII